VAVTGANDLLRTTDQPDMPSGGVTLDWAATTSQIPPAQKPVAGRHLSFLATRYPGLWECDPGRGNLADEVSPVVPSGQPGDSRHLPQSLSPDAVIIHRRPGEAGASAGSTRRCLGRLGADRQPQSDPNRHGNPLATRYRAGHYRDYRG